MTPEDTARVLARVQAYDRRTVGRTDIAAWHDAIGDLDADACHRAVVAHFRDETTWLMPAHIRRLVDEDARHESERRHNAELRRMLDSVDGAVGDDRTDAVKALLAELRDRLPSTTSADMFGRPEWRNRAARSNRRPRAGDLDAPNPTYVEPPPPGGFPVPEMEAP